MTDRTAVETARLFLDVLATNDFGAWPALTTEDIEIQMPFAPAGLPRVLQGRESCLEFVRGFMTLMTTFAFYEVDLHATDDAGLVFGTGRSRAMGQNGKTYSNRYCFRLRIHAGRVAEYHEYFDPQIVLGSFADELTAS